MGGGKSWSGREVRFLRAWAGVQAWWQRRECWRCVGVDAALLAEIRWVGGRAAGVWPMAAAIRPHTWWLVRGARRCRSPVWGGGVPSSLWSRATGGIMHTTDGEGGGGDGVEWCGQQEEQEEWTREGARGDGDVAG